jgi:hypothetical protein
MKPHVAWLFLTTMLILPSHAAAGECVETDEYFVGIVEGTIVPDIPPGNDERFGIEWKERAIEGAIWCLQCGCPATGTNRWAGPEAAACFKQCRSKPQRVRLIAALTPRIEAAIGVDSLQVNLYSMAFTLASWGVTKAGTFDVYAFIVKFHESAGIDPRSTLTLMAAMNDPRAITLLREKYSSLRAGNLAETRDSLVEILSCLYHLSDPSAVAFAAEIVKTESDPLLVERAKRVVNRP